MKRVLGVAAFVALMLATAVLTASAMRWAGAPGDPALPDPVVLEPEATVPQGPAVTTDPIEVRPAPERFERQPPVPQPSRPASVGPGGDDDTVGPGPADNGPGDGDDLGRDDDGTAGDGTAGDDGGEADG